MKHSFDDDGVNNNWSHEVYPKQCLRFKIIASAQVPQKSSQQRNASLVRQKEFLFLEGSAFRVGRFVLPSHYAADFIPFVHSIEGDKNRRKKPIGNVKGERMDVKAKKMRWRWKTLASKLSQVLSRQISVNWINKPQTIKRDRRESPTGSRLFL